MSNYCELFEYDPLTGCLKWLKATANSLKVGSQVGWKNFYGYLVTTVYGKRIGVHRIVWEMHHGEIPDGYEVDHINHIKHDNRLENLRIVDRNQQNKNKKMYRNNTSGIVGVSLRKKYNTWRAQIRSDGVTKHLGSFPDFISACEARIIDEVSLGFHKNHGGN